MGGCGELRTCLFWTLVSFLKRSLTDGLRMGLLLAPLRAGIFTLSHSPSLLCRGVVDVHFSFLKGLVLADHWKLALKQQCTMLPSVTSHRLHTHFISQCVFFASNNSRGQTVNSNPGKELTAIMRRVQKNSERRKPQSEKCPIDAPLMQLLCTSACVCERERVKHKKPCMGSSSPHRACQAIQLTRAFAAEVHGAEALTTGALLLLLTALPGLLASPKVLLCVLLNGGAQNIFMRTNRERRAK
jgi:hypothetical protein